MPGHESVELSGSNTFSAAMSPPAIAAEAKMAISRRRRGHAATTFALRRAAARDRMMAFARVYRSQRSAAAAYSADSPLRAASILDAATEHSLSPSIGREMRSIGRRQRDGVPAAD